MCGLVCVPGVVWGFARIKVTHCVLLVYQVHCVTVEALEYEHGGCGGGYSPPLSFVLVALESQQRLLTSHTILCVSTLSSLNLSYHPSILCVSTLSSSLPISDLPPPNAIVRTPRCTTLTSIK